MGEDEEEVEENEDQSFAKYWGWFGVMISMVNDDITKIETILEYPLIFCLNYLTYMKDLQEIREQKMRMEQAKLRMKQK
jgi:hypothetical protein